MVIRRLTCPLVSTVLLLAVSISAAQPVDPADDPLPKDAKVRFGVTRPILRTSPSVALLPGYTNFLAPTITGGIRRYDLGTGRPLQKDGIVGPGQVVASADGKRAAVARPGSINVVEVVSGKLILAVVPPDGVVLVGLPGVSLSADGKLLAYGVRGQNGRGEVVVCDVDQNEVVAQVETVQRAPVYPTLSRDGKTLVTHGPPAAPPTLKDPNAPKELPKPMPENADELRTAQVWEIATNKELFKARVTGMGGIAVASAISDNGELVALSAGDGPIDLFDVKTGKRLQTLLGNKGQGVRVAISPDGKTIASVGPDYRIQRWSVEGKPIGISEPPPGVLIRQITALNFADNQRAIAWLTAAQFAVAWESPTGKLLSPTVDHLDSIHSIALPKDGKDGITSGLDGRVFRWDFLTGGLNEEIHMKPARLPGQPLVRPVVNVSAEAVRAVWARSPTEIFDMVTGEALYSVPSPSSEPAPVNLGLSLDGLKLITVSRQGATKRNGSCVIWDLLTQQRLGEFDIPPSGAKPPVAVLSPDGTRVVLGNSANSPVGGHVVTVTSIDVKTGKRIAQVHNDTGVGNLNVTMAAASDTSLVLASSNGRIWSVDYVDGRVEPDIDKVVGQGEPPLNGPVVFSPDGKRFAVGAVGEPFTTYGVRVYDWPQKKLVHTFIGHAGPVSTMRFSADGSYLASGAQDTSVIVWDLKKFQDPR